MHTKHNIIDGYHIISHTIIIAPMHPLMSSPNFLGAATAKPPTDSILHLRSIHYKEPVNGEPKSSIGYLPLG